MNRLPRRIMIPEGLATVPAIQTATPPGALPPSGVGQIPRLPVAPVAPYMPPVPPLEGQQAPPPLGVAVDIESIAIPITLNDAAGGAQQQKVYTTSKRWRGIDINIIAPAALAARMAIAGNSIGIQLYAIVQGTRTLVATGRLSAADMIGPTGVAQDTQKWIVSHHSSVAEKFDVTLTTNFLGNAGDQVIVSLAASDETSSGSSRPLRDGRLGTIPLTTTGLVVAANSLSIGPDVVPYRVTAVDLATDEVATNVFFQLFDTNGPPGAGVHPVWVTPVVLAGFFAAGISSAGEASGLGRHDYVNGIFAGFSTTPRTFVAAAGNGAFQVWFT